VKLDCQRALDRAYLSCDEVDFIALYRCFPAAINLVCDALIVAADRVVIVAGAMPFGGGPLNNFILQATVKLVQKLREKPGSIAVSSCVSGMFTKQGFGVWSSAPYHKAFAFDDVTEELSATEKAVELIAPTKGDIDIVAATVLYEGENAKRLVAVCQYPDGKRTVSYSEEASAVDKALANNLVGAQATIDDSGLIDLAG